MFLLSDNGNIEAVNANQIEKLYLRYPSPNFGIYYDVVAVMASGREYVLFRGHDVDSATETLYAVCDEVNEIEGKVASKDD